MNIDFEQYETNRLILKNFTPQVYNYIFNNGSDEEIKTYLCLANDDELQNEKNRFADGMYADFKYINWFQLIEKASQKIIGYCGYHIWHKKHCRAEIGYYLLQDEYKQKGLMTEAVQFVLDYGFNIMKLNRVEAFTSEDNIASLKILAKFGFEKEGYCKEHYNVNGVLEDSVLLALLKKNYIINNIH